MLLMRNQARSPFSLQAPHGNLKQHQVLLGFGSIVFDYVFNCRMGDTARLMKLRGEGWGCKSGCVVKAHPVVSE